MLNVRIRFFISQILEFSIRQTIIIAPPLFLPKLKLFYFYFEYVFDRNIFRKRIKYRISAVTCCYENENV